MMLIRRIAQLVVLLVPVAAAGGCGPTVAPAKAEYVDVSGTVTLPDGKPLKNGAILFQPTTTGEGRDEMTTVIDGAFKLKMFVGKYKVAFDLDSKKTPVPAKYTQFATTDQAAEVTSETKPLTFTLK